MKMKKIGLLAMALVLVLGLTGAAFAVWMDDLTIEGTVNTGSVGGSWVWVSGTWVYKVLGVDNEIVVLHEGGLLEPGVGPTNPPDGKLIAYGEVTNISENEAGAETATVVFDNLFPCVWFCVDILWHYWGTVPAKVQLGEFTWDAGTDPDQALLLEDCLHGVIAVRCDQNGNPIDANDVIIGPYENLMQIIADPDSGIVIVDEGYQLHGCNYVLIIISMHVPQSPEYMNLYGSGSITATAVQWNKYEATRIILVEDQMQGLKPLYLSHFERSKIL